IIDAGHAFQIGHHINGFHAHEILLLLGYFASCEFTLVSISQIAQYKMASLRKGQVADLEDSRESSDEAF
ncbi:MAG: hypothetical protein OXI58_12255, partial [Gemmatimonadota bacterium]|nr:hypothetical protein [Gemmatimonadota bacterium]